MRSSPGVSIQPGQSPFTRIPWRISPKAVFFEGDSGQVGVFGVDADTLLVVLGERDTTMGMFNVAAKQTLALLQQAVAARR